MATRTIISQYRPHPNNHAIQTIDKAIFVSIILFRSASRVSIASKGVDLRIEELKSQNRQLLEELFTLKKACESKDEEFSELKEKVSAIIVKIFHNFSL